MFIETKERWVVISGLGMTCQRNIVFFAPFNGRAIAPLSGADIPAAGRFSISFDSNPPFEAHRVEKHTQGVPLFCPVLEERERLALVFGNTLAVDVKHTKVALSIEKAEFL